MKLADVFSDLEPLEQNEGPQPVVQIAATPQFVEVMGYFRRVLVNQEFSQRALQLSAQAIALNAANYTAWQFRRRCLTELHAASSEEQRLAAWRDELEFCDEQCRNNMKNYQVWFHRRACVEQVGEPQKELQFIEEILAEDAKNYHAWGHRQWALRTYSLWADELSFVERLIKEDLRNNSAWNQRYYVLQHTTDIKSPEVVKAEIAFASKWIEIEPNNDSSWAYLKGIVRPVGYSAYPEVQQMCERLAAGALDEAAGPTQEGDASKICLNALSLLVDILQAQNTPKGTARAEALCKQLQRLDPIRINYWIWRAQQPRAMG
ncbi:hypothetical protein AB1Y20_017548 [Prymnesium parvum]|uniref:Protein farnesyltransferase/geranylgeranyltransferase type-1 subunit alpha n=1 Tax=Prymnesium parvum TaxID=97485 RepID=A0AB34JPG4_PRYPA